MTWAAVIAAAPLPDPAFDPGEVRQAVDHVLSRPEYEQLEPGLFARLLGWLSEQIGRLIDLIAGAGAGGLVASVIILGAVLVVAVLGFRFARRMVADPRAEVTGTAQVGRSPAEWLDEAAAAEAAGAWRSALRCRYRGMIAELAEAGLVEEVPGRTSGEYLAASRASLPAAADELADATAAFDLAWYGNVPVGADDVATFARHADAVHRAARGGLRGSAVGASA